MASNLKITAIIQVRLNSMRLPEKAMKLINGKPLIQILIDIGRFYYVFKLLKIFPSKIRDILYDIFANNRYKWFGKSDVCHVPPKEIRDQFINK